jgi:diguanylate cyclase (GGDEF)-like protein
MDVKLREHMERSFRLAGSVRADGVGVTEPGEAAVMPGELRTPGPDPATRRVALITVAVLGVALALLWLVGRTLDRSGTTASNSQLVADLQVARATLASDVALATRKAAALGRLSRVEHGLATNDAAALRAVAATHPDTLLVAAGGAHAGSLSPLGVRRALTVVAAGRTLGRVVADAPLDADFLARATASLPSGSRDRLALTRHGKVVAGAVPAGTALAAATPRDVDAHGHTYRALGSTLVRDRPDLRVVALAPSSGSSAWRLPVAVLATLLALAVLFAFALGMLRRHDRRRPVPHISVQPAAARQPQPEGMSVAMLGEQLAAAKDVDGLLRVVLDAAIKATGAAGGRVARPGDAPPRPGERENEVLRVSLQTNEPDGDTALLLYPPPTGFGAEAAGIARWLGAHAGTAIRDARFHRVTQERAANDDLTGLANRARFTAALEREFARAERKRLPLSLVLGDLDDLKSLNDRLGFSVGDEVLKAFGATLRRSVRDIDLAARIGGGQFGVVLPETELDGATQFAERLRNDVRSGAGFPAPATASYGVAAFPQTRSPEELLTTADACLRQAKHAGKDRVVGAASSLSEQTRS